MSRGQKGLDIRGSRELSPGKGTNASMLEGDLCDCPLHGEQQWNGGNGGKIALVGKGSG